MKCIHSQLGCRGLIWPLSIIFLAVPLSVTFAQTPNVTRVEEDWELVVAVPAPENEAPQITCVISPVANVNSHYATFAINHHDAPSFNAGGLELQAWNGNQFVASSRFPNQAILDTPNETIHWTLSMKLGDEGVVYEVLDVASTSWGNFCGEGNLKLVMPTSLENLNGYSPDVSVNHSHIGYAANRVQSLVLKHVRVYAGDQLIGEDDDARVVHQLGD